MRKIGLLSAAAASAFLITGCQSNPASTSTQGMYPASTTVLEIISQETQEAMRATQKLTKYRQQYNETLAYRQGSFEEDQILLDYIGKPEPLLNSIAIRYGYRYVEVGVKQDLPIMNFTKYETTPEQALVDVDAQLGTSADISLDKQQKLITLVYPNAAQ